ncbi:translation initiation factor IF-2-like [Felis catus]|uniref:translation initiation factor IF-2-like n=1 Tax=Felis catus TaxID=9685 RepID=UPI001D19B1FD|nr:translation initiation factor IF-2-like [Felis catus]
MKQPEPGAHSPLWRTDTLDPTAISPQHLGPTTSACQTSLPCIPNKRMGQPHYCLVWQTPVSHFRPTGPRKPPRSATARRVASSPRQRPRSAQDRRAVTGCPWAPGGDRSGAAAAIPVPWGPGLLSAAASGPGPRRVKSGTCERPESEGLGTSLRMRCGGTRAGPAGGDSRKTRERKHPEGAPGWSEARSSARRAGAGMQPGLGSRTVAAGDQRDQRPSARSSGTGGRRRRRARSHLAWRAMSPSPSVGGSELHACAHT